MSPSAGDRSAGDTVALTSRGLLPVLEVNNLKSMLAAADFGGDDDVGPKHV
jgi:hypothetical protein